MNLDGGVVRLEDEAGALLSEVPIGSGWLLPLGPEVEIAERGNPLVLRLRPAPRSMSGEDEGGVIDRVTVGSLPVVTQDLSTQELSVVYLDLPPPRGFDTPGISEMWNALSVLPPSARAAVRRAALWDSGARLHYSDLAVHLPTLPDLLAESVHLLHNWPQKESVAYLWHPLGLPGGVEQVGRTLRSLHRVECAQLGDRVVPSKTVRRRGDSEPWKLHAVSSLAQSVKRRIAEHDEVTGTGIPKLLAPLDAVVERAQPSHPVADVSPSSWPAPLRSWHQKGRQVLAEAEADRRLDGRAPLCQFHDLFEAWVTVKVMEQISTRFGEPVIKNQPDGNSLLGKPTFFSRWTTEQGPIEVWAQKCIEAPIATVLGREIRSVTSTLAPDLLVATPNGLVAIDAKYTSKTRVPIGTVSATGSKYMWGLRDGPDAEAGPALDAVHVVTNAQPAQTFGSESLVRSWTMRPGVEAPGLLDALP